MTDFERLLRDSLKAEGEGYRPSDPYEAKQEFFRRRRARRIWVWAGGAVAAGAAATVAVVAFAILGPAQETARRVAPTVTPAVSNREPNVDPIPVGKGPNGISVGGGYAWAVDSENNSLVRINPIDNSLEHIDIEAQDPEDVLAAHGAVWVTDLPDVIRYDPLTGESDRVRIGASADLDLAAGVDDDVWVVRSLGELYRLDASSGAELGKWPVGETLADVSVVGSEVWLYDEAAGDVIGWDSAAEDVTSRTYVRIGVNADLVAGLRHVWFYRGEDGKLLQIDKETGDIVKKFPLGGTFAGLTIDDGTLWAMVTEGGPTGTGVGRLYQIDLNTAEEIAEPIEVADTPYDVAAGYGSVWVTNNETGQVTRISFDSDADPSVGRADIVFYYSDGNDIWAYYSDSRFSPSRVTFTVEPELSPTISGDGQTIVFQRGAWPADEPHIVRLELDTGIETDVGVGVAPAFGPDGRVAFGVPDPEAESPRIAIADLDGAVETIDLPTDLGPEPIERVAWDLYGDVLFLQTSDQDPRIVAFELRAREPVVVAPCCPKQSDAEGTMLVSPSIEEPGTLSAIELCCRREEPGLAAPSFTTLQTATLVRIVGGPVSDWRPSQEVEPLDDIFGLRAGFKLYAVTAGSLDFDADAGWTTTDNQAWFVGDGDELWLVNDSSPGVNDRMPLEGVQGIAVNPLFLNE